MRKRTGRRPITERFFVSSACFTEYWKIPPINLALSISKTKLQLFQTFASLRFITNIINTREGRFVEPGKKFVFPGQLREQVGISSPGPLARSVVENHFSDFGRNRTGAVYPRPKSSMGHNRVFQSTRNDEKGPIRPYTPGLRYEVVGPLVQFILILYINLRSWNVRKARGWDSPGPAYMTGVKNRQYQKPKFFLRKSHHQSLPFTTCRPKSPSAAVPRQKRWGESTHDSPGPVYSYLSAFTEFNRASAMAKERARTRRKKTRKIRPKHSTDRRCPFGEKVQGAASPGPGAYVYDPGFQNSFNKLRTRVHSRTKLRPKRNLNSRLRAQWE
eukprot:jgi/Bigna1/69352/fgenesh1_pg.8_\